MKKIELVGVTVFVMVVVLDLFVFINATKKSNQKDGSIKQKYNYIEISNEKKDNTEIENNKVKQEENGNVIDEENNEVIENNTDDEGQEKINDTTIIEPSVKQIIDDQELELRTIASQIDKSLNSDIAGKGYLITSYCMEKGIDPYLATAIILQETGCKWNCSYMVKQCNNVGGQKGSGCGSYNYFESLDVGITSFIDNLYNNYFNYGLTTAELMNSKYAADPNWSINVNKYIESIKAQ